MQAIAVDRGGYLHGDEQKGTFCIWPASGV